MYTFNRIYHHFYTLKVMKISISTVINSMFISILYFYISEVYNVDNTYITQYNMFIMK